MSKKIDKELINILEFEIRNVKANRHMDKNLKEVKIRELESLIEEEREKCYA